MTYRSDLDALEARHASLESEAARQIAERDDARRLLEDARQRARLPVLDNIRVAAPCSAKWADMPGSATVRHCGDCDKNVFNLSEMTREQAEATILEQQGKLCARYYQRADGTILTADCAVGTQRRRRRRWVAVGAAAMLAGAAFGIKFRPRGATVDRALLDIHVATQELGGDASEAHESVLPEPPAVAIMGGIGPMPEPIMGEVELRK